MRKFLLNIMCCCVIAATLIGCSSEGGVPSSNIIGNHTNMSQADAASIGYATEFSNGVAFVKYREGDIGYCIDKTGKELFELKKGDIYGFAKFNGKIAMIGAMIGKQEINIYDKTGKVYTAEDFGASRIVLETELYEQAFMDGYIFLERREESYTGTKIEMSIIDSDFTTLVPFSVELAETLNSWYFLVNGTQYYDGYLYFLHKGTEATILDLRTGALLSDTTQMTVSKPLLSYRSDGIMYGSQFEHLEGGDIYNALTGEVVAKVKEHETISQISFVGEIGLATYSTDNGDWFNVIDKNGAAKFDPIKIGDALIEFDGETILVIDFGYVQKANRTVDTTSLKTYDVNGNLLGELVVEDKSTGYIGSMGSPTATFNEGVIWVNDYTKYIPYNSSLEKLF